MKSVFRGLAVVFVMLGAASSVSLAAVVPREGTVQDKMYQDPTLYLPELHQRISELSSDLAARLRGELAAAGVSEDSGFYDVRAGRWSSMILRVPLLPGTGTGNELQWPQGAAPSGEGALKEKAWDAVRHFLSTRRELRLDMTQLEPGPRVGVFEDGGLVLLHAARVVGDVPVRNNSITATINHGNLILLGLENWGDIDAPLEPSISPAQAEAAVRTYVRPLLLARFEKIPHLELIPVDRDGRIGYRLAWVVLSRVGGDVGLWESLVDASTGELISFQDRNQYEQRRAIGGVYPVSNDQRPPDGQEQLAWPMPYADITANGVTQYTDTGGSIGCIPGSIQSSLSGLYVRIADQCGAVNETSASGDLDLGFGPAAGSTDCTVPAGHSAGDTKASRTGFYELNRIKEQARGYLPGNAWLHAQLTANMNITDTCNAFWDGAEVNFFKSGGGCRNTGEQAAIFDHEWGHGMDNNGVNPNIAAPGEAIADIHAVIRLNTSCIGRGFRANQVCGGYGDACDGTPATGCTGVRDVNFENHRCDAPHTISWITSGFTTAECNNTGSAPACPATGSRGPCNRETHCEGQIVAEAAWDLKSVDLMAPPYNYDFNTAHEITTRLFYLGAQSITSWYTCSVGGGCGATGGYLQVLAADDDNGNLTDGTPHMTAIRAAFERHEIHCATPAVVDFGCAGGPDQEPPVVTATPLDHAVDLAWTAVDNAATYAVFRTEGVAGCHFGKIKIAEIDGLTFRDTGLQNGRTYSYSVLPIGSNEACFGTMAACVDAVPAPGVNLAVHDQVSMTGGDGDPFLDNCEVDTISFDLDNSGTGQLTNVRILSVEPLTHPSTIVAGTFPMTVAPTLDECQTATANIVIIPEGMDFDEDSDFLVTATADELGAETRTTTLHFHHVESDLQLVPTHTYSFETDLEGWQVVSGTFIRSTGAGGNGTNAHVSSSFHQDNACDAIRSPLIMLSSTSTLSIYDRFDIEPDSGGESWDRANVSVFDVNAGTRTVVDPNGGTVYTVADGRANGTCATSGQEGWNAVSPGNPTFAPSTWSASALNPGGAFTGRLAQLDVRYGTDANLAGAGFDFDEVTVTDFYIQVPDAQSDTCLTESVAPKALAVDPAGNGVLEAGETATVSPTWGNIGIAAIDLTGTASNLTGPAGPTYDLTDAAAAYGTIGVLGENACSDCYSVTITGARPATHWDATVDETVTPTSTAKTWTLHVGGSFPDVASSSLFYPAIETVLHNGVTAGCGGGNYCPADSVTRQQMAVFLLKAKEGGTYAPPDCTTQVFDDVPCSSPFAPWVNELSARGVTAGCGGANYCPGSPTTRQQMAVFLLKTLEGSAFVPPACTVEVFGDVPCSSPFAPWINEIAARGVTGGCGGGDFCPTAEVARQQMAVFLTKTFGLVLYGP